MFRRFFTLWICLMGYTAFGQAYLNWQAIFGRNDCSQSGRSVKVLNSGGIMYLGYGTDTTGNFDISLNRFAMDSNRLWEVRIGTPHTDIGNYLAVSANNQVVIVGEVDSAGFSDALFVKTDTLGTQPELIFWGVADKKEVFKYVEETQDHGFITCGYITQPDARGNDFLVVKFDSAGSVMWHQTYGFDGNDYAQMIHETSDGGFILSGDSWQGADYDVYVLKLDENGAVEWDRIIGDQNSNGNQFVLEESSHKFFVIGESTVPDQNGFDIYLSRLDTDGSLLWNAYVGLQGTEAGFSALQLADGKILITGYSNSNLSSGPLNTILLEVDTNGNSIGVNYFTDTQISIGYDLQPAQDGSFLIAGSSGSKYSLISAFRGNYQANFNVVNRVEEEFDLGFRIYPNPAKEELFIETGSDPASLKVEGFDIMGKSWPMGFKVTDGRLDLSQIAAGVYWIRVNDGKHTFIRKLIHY